MASRVFLYHGSRKACTSEAKAFAFQKGLCRLEEKANRNLMKFSKNKCKVLHPARNNLLQEYSLETD